MEIELKKDRITGYARVFQDSSNREETIEAVVPDTMPDVSRIVDTDAAVSLRSKQIENGRLTVTGLLEGNVLYLPEGETALRRLSLSGPCTFDFDSPQIREKCRARITLRVTAADARMLNPRKVLLRVDVSAEADVYCAQELEFATGAENEALQTLLVTETVGYVSAVEEKTFVLTEEFTLPAGAPALSEILLSRVNAEVEDVKHVGGKLILQGTARLELLYAAAEGRRPLAESFSASFSQIMDMGGECGGGALVSLMQTACYVETLPGTYGVNAVSMELHLVAQAVCCAEREVRVLSDAYSCRYACQAETEALCVDGIGKTLTARETVREVAETPEAVGELILCYVVPGRPTCGGGAVKVPLAVHLLYMTDRDTVSSLCRKTECEMPLAAPEDAVLLPGCPRCAEPYASPAAGGLELRLPLVVDASARETGTIRAVVSLSLDMDAPLSPGGVPSVMVVRSRGGDLWALAKKYRSTPELIAAANPQPPEEGGFLLIPRAR